MTEQLSAFLERASEQPWSWGERDCALFAADWILSLTGIDGGAPWRGRYSTQLGCARILQAAGGIGVVMAKGAALAGLRPTATPRRGDIGILDMMTTEGRLPTAGICLGGSYWAFRGPAGILLADADPLAAWGL